MPGGPVTGTAVTRTAVTSTDLEHELETLGSLAGRPGGLFGPASMFWRVDREAVIFLAAGRALLLQLAHPWVAAGIAEHSRSLADPIGRFHRTFHPVFAMVFGTAEEAVAAARRLHRRHSAIAGTLPEGAGDFVAGSAYAANDVAALRWVHATLIESAILAYELVLPPFARADRERYWAEARVFARLFGIPQSALPNSWAEFERYVATMLDSRQLAVSPAARTIASRLLAGAGTGWRVPAWYRRLTAILLPQQLRREFTLPDGAAERRAVERTLRVLRTLYPLIPTRLRHVAPYQEACARLCGRQRPRATTRLLNRLWIGRSSIADPPAR
ncbi:MAG TPA: oxygenase MpaB family protein [Stellaceae bacterium]|nr:oxygenase MpaB family protein [Stellaceae bacterium]